MSEIKVPEGMLRAAETAVSSDPDSNGLYLAVAGALEWLTQNPIVPTDDQIDLIQQECDGTLKGAIETFQRIAMFQAKPEDPIADLRQESIPHLVVTSDLWNATLEEAFKRGQQSMIKKEKQP